MAIFDKVMKDVLGEALWDYYHQTTPQKLWIHNQYGPKEEMPVSIYFREEADMPLLELIALQQCSGTVLDIGAGAGSHALLLQEKEVAVTALEQSPKAVAVMQARGVEKVIQKNIFDYKEARYDTLLLLMNGIGLCATLQGLQHFLQHVKSLLNAGGQLLFDSSDVAYLYNGKPPKGSTYYGEIDYQYEYKKQKTGWFKWLYVDSKTLMKIATAAGWKMQVLYKDGQDQYLVRLTLPE
jgi:SAM-dependent methyltransferase